jgi:ABC-2 type transport system ATP-binding protein
LILDEPLTGLDAAMARSVKDALQEAVEQGATVIITTHILEVAERIADRIGIIAGGRLLAEGTLAELRDQAGSDDMTLEDAFIKLTRADA